MTLALYGHLFSSYTWKTLIALDANKNGFEFQEVGPNHPEHERVDPRSCVRGDAGYCLTGDIMEQFRSTPLREGRPSLQ